MPIEKLKPKPMVPLPLDGSSTWSCSARPDLGGWKYRARRRGRLRLRRSTMPLKNDPEFALALQDARQAWIDEILLRGPEAGAGRRGSARSVGEVQGRNYWMSGCTVIR